MYYGNGTSMLWKKSPWRSQGKKGVVYDLGPHLLDTYLYLFENFLLNLFFLINLNLKISVLITQNLEVWKKMFSKIDHFSY